MRLTKRIYAHVERICMALETNGDDVVEVWNDLRDRASAICDELSPRQLDVLADFGVRRLQLWGKL